MVDATDLNGIDEDTARRVLAVARSIAPCIPTLDAASEEGKDAIAILKSVIGELPAAGSARVRSQGRNGSTLTFADIKSAFTPDDRSGLRGLCSAASTTPVGLPAGSFPAPDGAVSRMWPESGYPA